jgi:hypothetical protein
MLANVRTIALALALASVAAWGVALAESAPLTLDEALDLARSHSLEITTAAAEVRAARRDLERVERDPLATGLERIQVGHVLEASIETLAATERTLRVTTLQRFVEVLEGIATVRDARDQADVATRTLAADRVRAEAGIITALDLSRSESDAERADRAAREAESDQALRWSELGLHLGEGVGTVRERGLAPIVEEPPPLAEADALAERSAGHAEGVNRPAGVAAAERALEIARIRLAGSDHEAASRNAVADARDAVIAAERRLADARDQAELQLRSSHQTYAAAFGRLGDALTNDANAATTLAAQRVRAAAGELALLALRQAEMERERSADAVRAARHAAWLAWCRLEQAAAG